MYGSFLSTKSKLESTRKGEQELDLTKMDFIKDSLVEFRGIIDQFLTETKD